MSNFLTTARRGVIDYLFDETAAVAAYFSTSGKIITWLSTDKFKPQYAASDMPLAIVTPTTLPISTANNVELEIEYSLHMEFYTKGRDPEPLEELLARVIDRLKQGRTDRFGLAASARFVTVQWTSPRLQASNPADEEPNAANVFWKAEFDLMCHLRR